MKRRMIERIVERMLREKLADMLHDVSWRMKQLVPNPLIVAEQMNLKHHLLTGYTTADNTPSAGHISWTDVHVVYEGVDYGPFSGESVNKYVWFDQSAGSSPSDPLHIVEQDTKPALTPDDLLLFVNDGGTCRIAPGSTMPHGAQLVGGSIGTGELGTGAVTSAILANGAVIGSKIGAKAVSTTNIADAAVGGTQIAGGAVDGTKIAAKAVGTGQIADGAVGATQLGNAAVTAAKLAGGAVDATKLNLLAHMLY